MVALQVGIDPMMYLEAEPMKEMVLREVIEQAQEAQMTVRKAEIEAIGVACANAVARMMKRSRGV